MIPEDKSVLIGFIIDVVLFSINVIPLLADEGDVEFIMSFILGDVVLYIIVLFLIWGNGSITIVSLLSIWFSLSGFLSVEKNWVVSIVGIKSRIGEVVGNWVVSNFGVVFNGALSLFVVVVMIVSTTGSFIRYEVKSKVWVILLAGMDLVLFVNNVEVSIFGTFSEEAVFITYLGELILEVVSFDIKFWYKPVSTAFEAEALST